MPDHPYHRFNDTEVIEIDQKASNSLAFFISGQYYWPLVSIVFQTVPRQSLGAVGLEPIWDSWSVFFGKMCVLGKKCTYTYFFSEPGGHLYRYIYIKFLKLLFIIISIGEALLSLINIFLLFTDQLSQTYPEALRL